MLDFTPVRNKEISITKLADGLTHADLYRLTNEMVDTMLSLIRDCTDADVRFVPDDPDAHDTYAANEGDVNLAWTLGHLIVHVTASAEESAFLAAELARGVPHHGRSRSEVPWQTVTTIAQCRMRLQESRRMRLASLDMWPDEPYLDNLYQRTAISPKVNAPAYFILGLAHDDSHLAQIAEVVRQAQGQPV